MGSFLDKAPTTRAIRFKQLRGDDGCALATLFDQHREPLDCLVELRLDPRIRARHDASGLVQDEVIDVARGHDARPCIVDTYSLWLDTGEQSCLAKSTSASRTEPQNANLMIGNTVGHYRITARLGAGGIVGSVFCGLTRDCLDQPQVTAGDLGKGVPWPKT
jgi:hypothetical protein